MSVGDLDLYGSAFHSDPYGELARLRAQDWYAGTAIGTAVLRYHEVQTLLSMRELRTPGADFLAVQGITDGPLVDIMRGFLLNADGAAHARVRRIVNNAFTTRRVDGFRPSVAAMADELIDAMAAREECDFVAAFAEPFALRVLYRFVGIPEDMRADLQRWTADVGLIFGFSVAEEVVRYCPSALLGVPRIAKVDVELKGLTLTAGSCVLPVTGSANRDESVFDRPDTLDITRPRTGHLTFGGGIHFCLGAALARVELAEALPRLAARIRNPQAAGPGTWLPPTEAVYGPLSLPIRYTAVTGP